MRRKLTLPVEPPVPMMTALRARMLNPGPLVIDRNAEHGSCIRRLVDESPSSGVRAGFRRRLFWPRLRATASGHCPRNGSFAPPDRPARRSATIGQSITAQCISRGSELPTEFPPIASGALSTKMTPCANQPFEAWGAVVGKGADDFAIVVAVIREAVRPDHRPVGQVAEQQIRGVLDAVFLLHAGAAAERNIAAAGDGVTADIRFRLDQDHRRSRLRARRLRRAFR